MEGDGYYGGANETRNVDRKTYYDWDSTFALAKSLQDDIIIFSDGGPGTRWVGNENGYAGATNWSTFRKSSLHRVLVLTKNRSLAMKTVNIGCQQKQMSR